MAADVADACEPAEASPAPCCEDGEAALRGAVPAEEAPGCEENEAALPGWAGFDCGCGFRELSALKAVEEYLAYHDLDELRHVFRRDVRKAGLLQHPSAVPLDAAQEVETALEDFQSGLKEEFFKAWKKIMPEGFRESSPGRALDLRLEAYFATYSMRKALEAGSDPEPEQFQNDLEPFRRYLAERNLDNVGCEEDLMPLFALPFVQRPHLQPQVRDVFTKRWATELQAAIEEALRSKQPTVPILYSTLEMPAGKGRQSSWQSNWDELVRTADFSLDLAAQTSQGVSFDQNLIHAGRRKLEQLREYVPGGMDLRLASRSPTAIPTSPSRGLRSRAATAPPQMPADIDFARLARFVCATNAAERAFAIGAVNGAGNADMPSVIEMLRALLQRLAAAEAPLAKRRGFLAAVACFDVLGARTRPAVLPALLANPETAELTLGLLAVMACEAIGRKYIVSNLACIEKVVQLLKVQPTDSSLHIQALAALQRLSLRRAPQDKMIQAGLVDWVVGLLGWQGEAIQGMPSEFSLEFGSALLMNLALRTAGKQRCLEMDTITVALNLMEHWNPQIRTHINGTLYSLLSVPSFRASARRAGLEAILRTLYSQAMSIGDEVSRRQIEYLLEQMNPQDPRNAEGSESGEEDDDDDENFLEEEELAGLLLGDRSGHSAEECLARFRSTAATAEAQSIEFMAFLTKSNARRLVS